MIGNDILARDPADANHPNSVPWGLLPTTEENKIGEIVVDQL
jgi:hypothetical protein